MAVKPKLSVKPKTQNKHKTAVKPDKKMEETMYQSEERYRTILDEMADAYFEVDIAGNYTFVNDSCCHQLGYSKEELIGTSFRGQTAKEEFDKVYKAFGNIYITGKPERGIFYKLIRKDGTTAFAELAGFPLQNPKGEVIGFRGVGRDITERRQMEESLRQSEERYRTIIENIHDGYFEVDLAGTLTFFNESLREIYGYPKEELLGMNNRQYTDKKNTKIISKLNGLFDFYFKSNEWRYSRLYGIGELFKLPAEIDPKEILNQTERLNHYMLRRLRHLHMRNITNDSALNARHYREEIDKSYRKLGLRNLLDAINCH